MAKVYTVKNRKFSAKNYLRELTRLRDRARAEILGERNKEYRGELKRLVRAIDAKIARVVKDMESDNKPSDEVK